MGDAKYGRACLAALIASAFMVGCTRVDPKDDAPDAAEVEADAEEGWQMGCAGFDAAAVPATYLTMKPCLEQLHWSVEWTAKETLDIRDKDFSGRHERDTTLTANGTQLYWTWEEGGSRAGHSSFHGRGNTIGEMILQRQGTATLNGPGLMESKGVRIDSKTQLQGPADGTHVAAIDRDAAGRTCVHLTFGASMRGTAVTHVPGRGDEEAQRGPPGSSRPRWIDRQVQEDPWGFVNEAASQVVCTGVAKDDYERLKAWYGLRIDDQAGTWTFQGTRDWSPANFAGSSVWQLTLRMRKERRTVTAPRSPN